VPADVLVHLDLGSAPPTPLAAHRPAAAQAQLAEIDGRTVAYFRVDGVRPGSDGAAEAEVVERALIMAGDIGCPVVGVIHAVGVAAHDGGLAGVCAWGRVARRAVELSGIVPVLLAVTGPCHGGLAPLLGLADHVVLTREATAYINGPRPVAAVTGLRLTADDLGGAAVHAAGGLASLVADDEEDAISALAELLSYLPDNDLADLPAHVATDPADRPCLTGPAAVPDRPSATYDVRAVVADVCDGGSVLEVRAAHAPNVVAAYGRIAGRPVAIVANQPSVRAGTLDIDASVKAARHVQAADAVNLPIVTFVDTPGYEPGRDLEWRGMIRHGAKLVHAYAAATVPRVCVILRKAYGGAYIVMDSRDLRQRPRARLARCRDRGDGGAGGGGRAQPPRDRHRGRSCCRPPGVGGRVPGRLLHAADRRRARLRRPGDRPGRHPVPRRRGAVPLADEAPPAPAPPPHQRSPVTPRRLRRRSAERAALRRPMHATATPPQQGERSCC